MDWSIAYRDVMVVLAGLAFMFIHLVSANGTFFGTTVSSSFPSSADGRRILVRYRWSIGLLTLGVLIMAHVGSGAWTGRVTHIVGGTVLWVIAHYQARVFRRGLSTNRVVSLETRELSMPGGWLFFVSPILILAVSAIFLRRIFLGSPPIVLEVAGFSIHLFAALLTALLLWLAYNVNFRTRQVSIDGLPIRRERDFKRSSFLILMLYAYVASLAPALLTTAFWTEFTRGTRLWAYNLIRVVLFAIPTVTAIWFIARWPKGEPQRPAGMDASAGDGTPDECWKLGLIYYNPADPAFIVARRMGWGWELNWANKWSWLFAIAAVAGPIGMAFLIGPIQRLVALLR